MPENEVNLAAPAQAVVKTALTQVALSLDAVLATLDALEDIPYHAVNGGLGFTHRTFEDAIKTMRVAAQQAAASSKTAVEQVGGVVPTLSLGGANANA